ncbi:acyl carrier protein [Qiania dongpingensis]|uniref:Acyl carrier protein n=1 Tax=Qiania dongpingensis TaxID=2763669 RepID=A0A7G9G899_9FIRM|nr:acyl carrier protein [Qiania dongpingensis]
MSCLISILENMKPGVDFANEISLIDSHILDSVDIMSLAMDIEKYFHVEVTPLEIVPENFQSANAIYEMILRLNAAR